MGSKENNEVFVEKIENYKSAADAKCELNGTKRAAEDNTEKVKKARKEENEAGAEGEELDEEEEEAKGEEDEDVLLHKKGNPSSKMSQMIKLDITQACYEELRCSVCSGYLSLAPIRLLPDGSALCCHCAPPNNVVLCKGLLLEGLLSKATFPCRYKEFGCTANVQFNNSLNHEDGCIHRPFPCASLPHTSCPWKGPASQVTGHFLVKHSNFVQQDAKIKLRIDQDEKGVLLVQANSGSFLVKYAFNSTTCSLSYQIRLCMVGVDDRNCKLQLSNDFDPDYNVNLKVTCFAYNTDLCNESLLNVDVKPLLAVLNNPKHVTVLFHVKLPTITSNSCPNNEIDYKLLDSNRCGRCQYFLVPPVCNLKKKIICGDCSFTSGSTLRTNKTLENLLTLQNFPCRWRGCNFIGNGGVIRRHQTECDFRLYICLFSECGKTFKRSCAKLHMEGHDYDYFCNEYVDTFTFQNTDADTPGLCTIVDYEIILLNTKSQNNSYILSSWTTDPTGKIAGAVYFSHQHCKCQSKKFSILKSLKISLSELPTCFKSSDRLSATIKIGKRLNL